MSESKKTYEVMVIIKPELNQKQTDDALSRIRKYFTEAKGTIDHEDVWGKRELAYLIKGHSEGYYAIFYVTMSPDKITEVKKELDLETALIRKLIVTFPSNLTISNYLSEAKKVDAKIAEEEEVKQKERDELEKKSKARRGIASAAPEEKVVVPETTVEDKKRITDEVEDILGDL